MGPRVAVQGTGHGAAPLDDTVLIKTRKLQEVAVDSANRRARVWTSWQERKTAPVACLFARWHRL
jgi:hypothetical protein